ncbi:hypothetical protein A3D11_02315 [Candidatus Peribacteria bacterium RIFCSPHIGHO2_02_FULL_49_16]|nr:MAG: hypothetical protein A2880_03775 [Candidatus Peribacteria bacterium RIFCSPHIGHO2_01_FULL_49_38]OGJ59960.1 MAG: hypothetical protein A3D11_02315 [Candidatus Peribacteria bacterium RIFCSPHIGHO2_02_FULL_49_16]
MAIFPHPCGNLITQTLPFFADVIRYLKFFRHPQRTIHTHPCHDFPICMVTQLVTHFPNATVFFLPMLCNLSHKQAHNRFSSRRNRYAQFHHKIICIDDRAINVQLFLSCSPIPDTHRLRFLISPQVRQREFPLHPLTPYRVHDCNIHGTILILTFAKSFGNFLNKVKKFFRFIAVSQNKQCVERECCIPKPYITIIPIANTTNIFR